MAESPAELLERAAAIIEEYAADASPGPWFYNGRITYQTGGHMLETEDRTATREQRSAALGDVDKQGDACWIATLNPALAAPLVAWLRGESRHAERFRVQDWTDMSRWPSVQFARLVLGLCNGEPS